MNMKSEKQYRIRGNASCLAPTFDSPASSAMAMNAIASGAKGMNGIGSNLPGMGGWKDSLHMTMVKSMIQSINTTAKKNQEISMNPYGTPAIGAMRELTMGMDHAGVMCSIPKCIWRIPNEIMMSDAENGSAAPDAHGY